MQKNPQGEDVLIAYQLITNYWQGKDQFRAKFILSNQSTLTLGANWVIYFNSVRNIYPESVSKDFIVKHINGDFFSLSPASNAFFLTPGEACEIEFSGPYWVTKISDAPAGFYIVYVQEHGLEEIPQSLPPVTVKPFTEEHQKKRRQNDCLPSPSPLLDYLEFQSLHKLPAENLCPITPEPQVWTRADERFILVPELWIYADQIFDKELNLLVGLFKNEHQIKLIPGKKSHGHLQIVYATDHDLLKEGSYRLHISEQHVIISAQHSSGVFYAIQSLRQLMHGHSGYLSGITIYDFPLFTYRGVHLDVARNFHSLDTVKKMLEMMAYFKLNKFHIHLTDDEGWRIEIPGLPELTSLASKRGHTHDESQCLLPSLGSGWNPEDPSSPGNGYYTPTEFIDLLRYARDRHIDVIPAIDMPGHARAAIKAMTARYHHFLAQGDAARATEYLLVDRDDKSIFSSVQMWNDNVVNVALPSTYRFLEKVVDELMSMYTAADHPLTTIHLGGDEVPAGVWSDSPSCRELMTRRPDLASVHDLSAQFINQVIIILQKRGLRLSGWEEICLNHFQDPPSPDSTHVDKQIIPYFWNTAWGSGGEQRPYQAANQGYQVVLCNAPNLYLDFAYTPHPDERGYYWGGFNSTRDVFRFLPLSLYRSALHDAWGQPLADDQYVQAEGLYPDKQNNILGIQGQLWSETLNNPERLEYMALPRLIALAERAWSKSPSWAQSSPATEPEFLADWNAFANRLGQIILPQLDHLCGGFRYRLAPPGVLIQDGRLTFNCEYPGQTVHYTLDGSVPDALAPCYNQPVALSSEVKIIKAVTVSTTGRTSRIAEKIYQK